MRDLYQKVGPTGRLVLLCGLLILLLLSSPPDQASAHVGKTSPLPSSRPAEISEHDANCLMCHSDPDFKGTFADGDMISLYVDQGVYQDSVHGPAGLNCVACHTQVSGYPHHTKEQISCVSCHGVEGGTADSYATLRVSLPYRSHREMSTSINEACRACHKEEFDVAV